MILSFITTTSRPIFSTAIRTNQRICSKCSLNDESSTSTARSTRRQFLQSIAIGAIGLSMIDASPALADRTGKYSTKLTAKRRYLPRIARGLRVLENASAYSNDDTRWINSINEFINLQEDFIAALKLFGTSYFAEGNRIGAIEKQLTTNVEMIEIEVEKLMSAVKENDKDKARLAYDTVCLETKQYVETAKIQDSLISFAPK